jgi:SAM-dependent methyltransferase
MGDKKGAYYPAITPEELEIYADFEFPHKVSVEILQEREVGTLYDLGCGPDFRLAQYVYRERGASYVGIDNSNAMDEDDIAKPVVEILGRKLTELDIPAKLFQADIRNIDGTVPIGEIKLWEPGIAHGRFVLMHMSEEDRVQAILQCLHSVSPVAIFSDYDWGTLHSTDEKHFIKDFKRMAVELMGCYNTDPFSGNSLERVAVKTVEGKPWKVTSKRFPRPEGPWTGELVKLTRMMIARTSASQTNRPNLAKQFQSALRKLESSIFDSKPVQFVPADIVSVIIEPT